MNIKQLSKATKILEQIKALDAQIIEIDKLAQLAASGDIKASFELMIMDIGKQKEEKEKVKFDGDGSIMSVDFNGSYNMPFQEYMQKRLSELNGYLPGGTVTNCNKNAHSIKNSISESVTLEILGVLLCQKHEERNKLTTQIINLGIEI